MTPVTMITGFLGSGKTTLLGRLLRDPAMQRTAVIVNEFGEIPLDHDLIQTSDESFIQLTNGCICCSVTSDLGATLHELAARRAAHDVPCFERVAIETSGLADPVPLVHALMRDRAINSIYELETIVTTVDAVTGLATIERYTEALRQAAIADTLVITKSDLREAQTQALIERLRMVNPGATLHDVQHGVVDASVLLGGIKHRLPNPQEGLTYEHTEARHRHSEDFQNFCIVREEPVSAVGLTLFLTGLADNLGPDLLRMKGIVNVLEDPERPAVIHGVQHVYYAPEWLERWPSADRRTRLVFIGRHKPARWVSALLELLDEEVKEAHGEAERASRSVP
jgi:G3E family GTPase